MLLPLLPVLEWCETDFLFKELGKIAGTIVAAGITDLRDRLGRLQEKVHGRFQATVVDNLHGCPAIHLIKAAKAFGLADIGCLAQIIDGDGCCNVLMDIGNHGLGPVFSWIAP